MEYRYGDRPRRDADDLLLNGFFKTTRAQSTSSAPTNTLRPSSRTPSRSPAPASIPRSPKNIPPRPTCEDEVVALAKEVPGAHVTALHTKDHEPPFRGTIDQQPIILESSISAADAAKLHKKLNSESEIEDSGERRYVLIPRDDTHSPIRDDEEAPRRSYTAPLEVKPSQNVAGNRSLGKDTNPVHPLERRRSKQDLPALDTEMPHFRRSTSAYAYTPTSKQSARSPRPVSGEFLRSPDASQGRSPSKGYFDIPTNAPPRQSLASTGTPIVEKRRSGGQPSSRPTTPVLEKRNSGGPDATARLRQGLGEKLTKAQQLSAGNSSRRPERAPSAQGHLDAGDHSRHRKSSSRSSHRQYSSSDDDQDSSDSERRRRRHHHHRHHSQNTLRPDEDRDRHHRSGSKSTLSSDGKPVSRPGSRLTSPLASPFASPNVSPSQLPPVEKGDTLRNANIPSGRDSGRDSGRETRRPSARPVSPLTTLPASTRSSNTLDPSKDAARPRARSRSRPRSRRSSPTRDSPTSTLPIPIPTRIDVNSPGDTRRSPVIPHYNEEGRTSSTRPPTSEKPYWQPPPFQPPLDSNYLERPVGSYRRYSQDVDEGNIAPLPPCPRTKATRGYTDWLTLPRCPEDSFNICPSCFESTIAPTEFYSHFVASPMRSAKVDVLCDFGSQPWYRIAWLLTRKDRRKDLRLISSLAEIADKVQPCLGKHEAVRHWYSVVDPRTGNPIRNFDVCYSCVKSIETLLPALKNQFVRTDHKGPPGLPRVCDMRFDSKRFVHYFDALETAADSSEDSYPPDITEFADLAKRYATIPECTRDETLSNAYWYIITQLPEFSVCPECYDEVVLPELERHKPIPAMFNKSMQRLPSASCQLYSPRMRAIFEKAVSGNDYKLLASKARERRMREFEIKKDIAEQKRLGKGGEKEIKRIENEWPKWE